MPWQALASKIIFGSVIIGLILWNIYATKSTWPSCDGCLCPNIRELSAMAPIIPFLWGILTGHLWFLNPSGPILGHMPSLVALLSSVVIVLALSPYIKRIPTGLYFTGLVVLGVLLGHLLWPES